MLYTFNNKQLFFPEINAVSKAIDTSKDTYSGAYDLKQVLVTDEDLIATDGHILIMARGIAGSIAVPGFYRVVKHTKREIIWADTGVKPGLDSFPSYTMMLAVVDKYPIKHHLRIDHDYPEEAYCKIIRAMSKNYVAWKYWMMVQPFAEWFALDPDSPDNCPIHVRNQDRTLEGILMPIMEV